MSWLNSHLNDAFVKKRIKNDYISRSYFKIEQINQKYKIINKNAQVLDLGACPGGWSQYIWKYTHNITPVDINKNWKLQHISLIQEDIFKLNLPNFFDLIVSDIACNLSGNIDIDGPSMDLIIEELLNIINKNLRKGGSFVCKLFDYNLYIFKGKKLFEHQHFFKPEASKSKSSEIYFIGKNFLRNI